MPRFDGTGPQGQGAMGGRRRGRCEDATPFSGEGQNCGLRRRHRQRGRGNALRLVGPEQESDFVQTCLQRLKSEIQSMQERLDRLLANSSK